MDGETFGPYSVRELMGLDLLDDTLVMEESMNGEWHHASEFDFEDLLRKEESSPSHTISSISPQQSSSTSSFFRWIFVLVAILLVVVGATYIFNGAISESQPIYVNPSPMPVSPTLSPTPNPQPSPESPSQKVVCPMCSGRGFTEPMPGDIMSASLRQTCTSCAGTGVVTPEKSAELLKMMQDVNRMINPMPNPSPNPSPKRDNSTCWDCNGRGICGSCAGRGEKRYEGQYGQPDGIMDCPICHGTGKCQTCHGRGHI